MAQQARAFQPGALSAFQFGIQLMWGAILAVSLQARSEELGHGNMVQVYSLIAAGGAAFAAIVQIIGGRAADLRQAVHGHRHEFYLVGAVGAVPCILWLYTAPTIIQFASAFFALQLFVNLASGPYQAAIPDHAPTDRQGETSSWMSALQSLGAAVGLLIAGAIHQELLVGVIVAVGFLVPFGITYSYIRSLDIYTQPAASEKPHRLFGILGSLLISRGLINVGFYTLLGFLLFFVKQSLGIASHDQQRLDTAFLFLIFTLTAIIGAIAAARPTDTRDPRIVITYAATVMIIALLALAAVHSLTLAFMAATVAGIAWGALITADWALACAVLPRESMATAMGVWNLASVIPQIVAPLIAAPLVVYGNSLQPGTGPRLALVLAATTLLCGAIWIWRVPRITRELPAPNEPLPQAEFPI